MGMSSALFVTLGAALMLIICGGIVVYALTLVKSAYEIKVQIRNDIEERLVKMGEELDQKTRRVKLELIDDINKVRAGLAIDNGRRLEELADQRTKRVDALPQALRAERGEWVRAILADRLNLTQLDGRAKALARILRGIETQLGIAPAPAAPPPSESAAADALPSEDEIPVEADTTQPSEPQASPTQ